jgi:uncharacterized integral membrane protein
MIRKIVTFLVLGLLAALLVMFAVANRQPVAISLDPFDQADPALVFSLPLYQLIFSVLIGGVLLGGAASWLRQSKWRRRARRLESEARSRRAPSGEPGAATGTAPFRVDAPRLTIPPSAA